MYLWRIELDLSSPQIRSAMRDHQKLHRLITGFFNASRQDAKLLFRYRTIGHKIVFYIYSSIPINRNDLPKNVNITGGKNVNNWLLKMKTGQTMNFDLLTMPFKKAYNDQIKNSRRKLLQQPEERLNWLNHKAEQNGFIILSVKEKPSMRIFCSHSADRGGSLYLDTWQYTGTLQITDEIKFRSAVQNGIGPNKAYGLGMLLLA